MHVHALSLTIQSKVFCRYVQKKMFAKADRDTSVLYFFLVLFSLFCFLTTNENHMKRSTPKITCEVTLPTEKLPKEACREEP